MNSTHTTASGLVICDDGIARPPWASTDEKLRLYYDTEWGRPITDEQGVFERLSLEAFQAGLSWKTVLYRRPVLRRYFHGFHPDRVQALGEADVTAMMADPEMIRNGRKIRAVITNAAATVQLRDHGGLAQLVWSFAPATHHRPRHIDDIPSTSPQSVAMAEELKKCGFRFVGPTTCYALMQAIGLVDDTIDTTETTDTTDTVAVTTANLAHDPTSKE